MMLVDLKGSWALVLGVSSGFGAATARALADQGVNVLGVHFDMAAGAQSAVKLVDELRDTGVEAHFFNLNAASAATRGEVVSRAREVTEGEGVRIVLHSLAFGSLLPFLPGPDAPKTTSPRQLEMTVDVM